jgi:hypothetical protein
MSITIDKVFPPYQDELYRPLHTLILCPVPTCHHNLVVGAITNWTSTCTLRISCPNCHIDASILVDKFNTPSIDDYLIDQLKSLIYEQHGNNPLKFSNLQTWKSYSKENYKPTTHKQFRINRKILNKK